MFKFNAEILHVEVSANGVDADYIVAMVSGRVAIITHRWANGNLVISNEIIEWVARETESNAADIALFSCFPGVNNQDGAVYSANGEWYWGNMMGDWMEETITTYQVNEADEVGLVPAELVIGETYLIQAMSRSQSEALYGAL